MCGLICIDDLGHEVINIAQRVAGPATKLVVIRVDKSSSLRRFIYLAEVIRKSLQISCDNLVVVCTNWIKELAEDPENNVGAARAIDRVMLRFGAVNIVTSATLKKALVKLETLQAPRMDVIEWNGEPAIRKAIERVQAFRQTQWPEALNPKLTNVSGHLRARAIMVGEKINPYMGWDHWPFFDDRDAALFISQALEKANILESDLMWTNVIHPTESMVVDQLLVWKPTLKVVAMGEVAHAKLSKLNIKYYRRVSHPAWVRRFKHDIGYYADILDRAIRD